MNLKEENPSELFRAGFFPEDPEAVKNSGTGKLGGPGKRQAFPPVTEFFHCFPGPSGGRPLPGWLDYGGGRIPCQENPCRGRGGFLRAGILSAGRSRERRNPPEPSERTGGQGDFRGKGSGDYVPDWHKLTSRALSSRPCPFEEESRRAFTKNLTWCVKAWSRWQAILVLSRWIFFRTI